MNEITPHKMVMYDNTGASIALLKELSWTITKDLETGKRVRSGYLKLDKNEIYLEDNFHKIIENNFDIDIYHNKTSNIEQEFNNIKLLPLSESNSKKITPFVDLNNLEWTYVENLEKE